MLIGFGTFLIYLTLLKYVQYDHEFYVLPATMWRAGQVILAAFVSTLPIMLGLSFFCMTYFGSSDRFASLDRSVIMLWASMNGDEV